MSSKPGPVDRKQILSIALEDYFHGPAFSKFINRKHWARFETRFEQNCLEVLDKLAKAGSKATFFVNAWTAQSCPELSREVIRRGHELALAGARDSSFRFLTPDELRRRVRADRDIVEAACGRRILGYRVTDVLLSERDLWALEVLAEEGFSYDSSLSPFFRRFARQPWRQFIHQSVFKGSEFWEVPLSSYRLGRMLFPIAGGNYFRQYPEALVRFALDRFTRGSSHPLVLYFRLWDFDPAQPRIETGSMIRQFRHYRNRERIVKTLSDLLITYQFTSIAGYLGLEQKLADPPAKPAASVSVVSQSERTIQRTPVSVIVPCYNEESSISYLMNSLGELKAGLRDEYDLQFILVDDGSTDHTWQVLNKHFSGSTDTLLIRHEKNQGVAGAIATGLAHSREIACSMDCDCSYDPFLLRPMLKMLQDGVDLVTASPYHPDGAVRHVPAWRLTLSRGASFLYRTVTGRKLYTFTACLRVYRRSAAVPIVLRHSGFLGVAELLGRLAEQGSGIAEYPATLESRIFGRSKMKVVRTTIGHVGLLSTLAYSRFRKSFSVPAQKNSDSSTRTNSDSPTANSSSAISAGKL